LYNLEKPTRSGMAVDTMYYNILPQELSLGLDAILSRRRPIQRVMEVMEWPLGCPNSVEQPNT
jgi:hypothetical protein